MNKILIVLIASLFFVGCGNSFKSKNKISRVDPSIKLKVVNPSADLDLSYNVTSDKDAGVPKSIEINGEFVSTTPFKKSDDRSLIQDSSTAFTIPSAIAGVICGIKETKGKITVFIGPNHSEDKDTSDYDVFDSLEITREELTIKRVSMEYHYDGKRACTFAIK